MNIKTENTLSVMLKNFITSESFGGIFLFLNAVLAMIVANSFLKESYFALWHVPFGFQIGDFFIGFSLHHWIDDVLMALFFLMIGLEIKRELLFGELSDFKKASFPVIAAIGGMVVPGLIYFVLNTNTPSQHGFGIPMATDIAFALGVVMLLGKRVPVALKVFLITLAVADDLGAIIVIAVFYTTNLKLAWLLGALGVILGLALLNRLNVRLLLPYLLLGVVLWFCVHESGIHATIAAVILAFMIPVKMPKNSESKELLELSKHYAQTSVEVLLTKEQQQILHSIEKKTSALQSPLERLEHFLAPISGYFIMPLFAFANAGVSISSSTNLEVDKVLLGVILGLCLGKPLGIFLITFIGEKLKITARPKGISWWHILGAGLLAGIGFTMSMFISNLAFTSEHKDAMEVAKIAILLGSLISGIFGALYLFLLDKRAALKK
ncbi:sodium/proton antiporter NhaA [Helicobacter cetorum]|uniref:Na(+)/H(+) antiporter NhaA n=1 Tax=Helicobacter cetorum (strain ATCC BAA-540 / CCUG 52418 / MIT 99-5656) TaxID=1163745 RepID=I0ES74_HELCM|nr:sodium/proton antiporter NhaA [Helicobacter cetorum]AFI05793.1 pH-dependent sodium/proton antiporter [Helicobacter cetorum MIT 99-5656]